MTDLNKLLISNEIKISIKKKSKKQTFDFKPLPAILAPWPVEQQFTNFSVTDDESCPLGCKAKHLLASCPVYQG